MKDSNEIVLVESVIISEFRGWKGNSIFEFQNGQVWKQAVYNYFYMYAYRPNVKVVNRNGRVLMIVNGNEIPVIRIK